MKQVIGFATQFYTLWDYSQEPTYQTDAYGNHHCTGVKHIYSYIKNISTDLDKVKVLYPTLVIDESVKGKTNSFDYYAKQDLPANYFWGGKYRGKLIDEIMVSDFQYCLWSALNYGGKTADYIKAHPIYLAHIEAEEKAKQTELDNAQTLKVGDVVELEFVRNGYNADEEYKECWTEARLGETEIAVCCGGVRLVEGMYPYLMPMINGKAQKTKGKKIEVKVTEVFNTGIYAGVVKQQIRVA